MHHPHDAMIVTQDQEDAVLAAIREIGSQLHGLVSLECEDRASLAMLAPKYECFARSVIRQLQLTDALVPPGLDVRGAIADLAALDRMRKIDNALQQLACRVEGTMAALGSDVMDVAQAGYGMLKLFGEPDRVQGIRKEFGYRHARAVGGPRPQWMNREIRPRENAH